MNLRGKPKAASDGVSKPATTSLLSEPETRRDNAIRHIINVGFEHQVLFTEDLFAPENKLLARLLRAPKSHQVPKVLAVMDESLHSAQPQLAAKITAYFQLLQPTLKAVSPPVIVEGGERLKNSYFHVSEIQSEVDRYNMDRHSFLIAIGGGALLDVAGLAAATAHRGIRHVRVPSTTLSQADSGVGVKNGINAFGKKNFIGSFAVPFAVINDFTLLSSLSPRDKRCGYSEAIKVACIKDAEFFAFLEQNSPALRMFEPSAMRRLIYRSAELHLNHIACSGDPFEFGSARPLDFGHWSAHKLEQLSDYRIRHGEAVAIGIALDVIYSRLCGWLRPDEADRVLGLIEALGFELYANELFNEDSSGQLMVLRGLEEFRNHLGGELTITLLRSIGHGFEVHEMDEGLVARSIQELRRRQDDLRLALGATPS